MSRKRFGIDNKHKRRKVQTVRLDRELVAESKKTISLSEIVSRTLNGVSDRYKAPERLYKNLRRLKHRYGNELYRDIQSRVGNNYKLIQIQGNVLKSNVFLDFLRKQESATIVIGGRKIDKQMEYK